MKIRNTASGYGLVSKLLHWGIGLSILFLIALGWYMVDLTYFDRWYNDSLSWHKSHGMLVLGVAVVYFAWKVVSPSPGPVAALPIWQRYGANVVHALLMVSMVVLPVSGYLISTSAGQPVSVFGWFAGAARAGTRP